ncbi:hypothetical protein [Motilimonas cestriensis]|uniref:hypothetical protein n=1 Tax=Motilimonas cestriensis TaxID=2742685 RepID=UPI003DA439D0
MTFKLTPIALLLATGLVGCGGGSSSSGSSAEQPITPTVAPTIEPPANTLRTNVTVVDDYLSNALVWMDLDGDFLFDANEPSVRTNANGVATLDYPEQYSVNDYHLVAKAIAGETVDMRTGKTVTRDYYLTTPKGKNVITPLTSLTQGYVDQGQLLDDAVALVCQRLGQNQCDLFKDYVADKDHVQLGHARAYMNIMPSGASSEVSFSLALDNAQQIDDALDQWQLDNQLDSDSINWQLVDVVLDQAGIAQVNTAMAEDYLANRDIALVTLSASLERLATAAVEMGLNRQSTSISVPCAKSGSTGKAFQVGEVPNTVDGVVVTGAEVFDKCTVSYLERDMVQNGMIEYKGTYQNSAFGGDLLKQSGQVDYNLASNAYAEGIDFTTEAKAQSVASYNAANKNFAARSTGIIKLTVNGQLYLFKIGKDTDTLYYPYPHPVTGKHRFTSGSVSVFENTVETVYEVDQYGWWTEIAGQRYQVKEYAQE